MPPVVLAPSEPAAASGGFDSPRLGRIHVTDRLDRALLEPLLTELRHEPCAHSWQPVLARTSPAAAFDAVESMVARGRPGRVFTYWRNTAGGPEPLALGVVSDRVATDYPYDGLPVLGRAFIRPAYRRQTLYPGILRHRLDYCRSRWGDKLLAIHLGTASTGVEHSFRSLHAGSVVYLGDEDLGEAGQVRALLGLTDAFAHDLAADMPSALGDCQAAVLDYLARGAAAVRPAAIAAPLERLADCHAGFDALRQFLRRLTTLR